MKMEIETKFTFGKYIKNHRYDGFIEKIILEKTMSGIDISYETKDGYLIRERDIIFEEFEEDEIEI